MEKLTYEEFLRNKVKVQNDVGINPDTVEIPDILKPHQKDSLRFALRCGRALLALSFGLGKTIIQGSLAKIAHEKTGQKTLTICPLGVRQEFTHPSTGEPNRAYPADLGVHYQYCTTDSEIEEATSPYIITNYERVRDGDIIPDKHNFCLVSLDEASIIGNLGTKTYAQFETLLENIPYKYICTATPAPNEYRQLIYYANILGVMTNGEALAQPLNAKVLTPTGWKQMGDIKVGDYVISQNGKGTLVVKVYPREKEEIYEVEFSDGAKTRCTLEHLWVTKTQLERNNEKQWNTRNPDKERWFEYKLRSTEDIIETIKTKHNGNNHSIPTVCPVEFDERKLLVDPYLMGIALGDGCIRKTSVSITTNDEYIVREIDRIVSTIGLSTKKIVSKNRCNQYAISSNTGSYGGVGKHTNEVLNGFNAYGLLEKRSWEKYIPEDYKINTVENRISILQGLMDSDGSIDKQSRTSFLTTSEVLAQDFIFLVQSLGGITHITQKYPHKSIGKVNGRDVIGKRKQYKINFSLPESINPFRLPRKANRVRQKQEKSTTRFITSILPVGKEKTQCIAIDNDSHLYVTDDFIVTHNTRFFGRDVNKAGNLQLLPQYEEEFWLWVSTWALFLYKPSDLGYSDVGYELPELNVYWHRLPVDHTQIWNEVDNKGQYKMLSMASGSINDMHKDKHRTMLDRMAKAKEIVDSYPETGKHNGILLWHDYEYERQEIEHTLRGYDLKTVYGSQDLEKREQAIVDFQDGKYRILATKPVIAGSGCNFQHWSHVNVFLGVSYKWKDFIQSVHRTHRFMQSHPVDLHIIYSESEDGIVSVLKEKWEKHNKLTKKMQLIVQEYGLSKKALEDSMQKTLGVPRREMNSTLYKAYNNDNTLETRNMPENSVDLIVTSIPFDNHYEYTTVVNDFSFNDNNFKKPLTSGFWQQMDYLTPELLRVTKPGRKAVIHVKDRILYSYQVDHGLTSTFPFSDETVMHFISHGWVYEGRRTIVTDVVRENNSTYRLGYSEMSKDASKMGSGLPEYLLTFRKPNTDKSQQYADERVNKIKYGKDMSGFSILDISLGNSIGGGRGYFECGNCGHQGLELEKDFDFVEKDRLYTKYQCPECGQYLIFYSRAKWQIDAHSFWQSNGNILIPKEWYDYDAHAGRMETLDFKGNLSASYLQEPPVSHNDMVWDDVVFMQCLNSNQTRRRVTNHVCPLPLDIVRRAIMLYSNFNETVYDPFAGLFTVPYLAIQLGRIGMGCELNSDYYNDGVVYCNEAEQKKLAPTLFDLLKLTEETN